MASCVCSSWTRIVGVPAFTHRLSVPCQPCEARIFVIYIFWKLRPRGAKSLAPDTSLAAWLRQWLTWPGRQGGVPPGQMFLGPTGIFPAGPSQAPIPEKLRGFGFISPSHLGDEITLGLAAGGWAGDGGGGCKAGVGSCRLNSQLCGLLGGPVLSSGKWG